MSTYLFQVSTKCNVADCNGTSGINLTSSEMICRQLFSVWITMQIIINIISQPLPSSIKNVGYWQHESQKHVYTKDKDRGRESNNDSVYKCPFAAFFQCDFEMYLLSVLICAKVACLCLYQVAKYPSNILKNCVSQVGKGSKHWNWVWLGHHATASYLTSDLWVPHFVAHRLDGGPRFCMPLYQVAKYPSNILINCVSQL